LPGAAAEGGPGGSLGQRCYTTQNTSLSIKFLKWNFKSLKGSGQRKKRQPASQEEFAMRLLYLGAAAATATTTATAMAISNMAA